MIGYCIPTHNRQERLAQTLDAIAALGPHNACVVVVDNASDQAPDLPARLASGLPVRLVRLEQNLGAAARNRAVEAMPHSVQWFVMLDDDSHPTDLGIVNAIEHAPRDAAAIMADIHLPGQGRRESGGLPEVFVGCGVAIRREAWNDAAGAHGPGYDPEFGYYAEEYDLAARFLMSGWRIVFDPIFRVDHHKVHAGRDIDRILERLVRNNAWVMQRYAPADQLAERLEEIRTRYGAIARKEHALDGYGRGIEEMERSIGAQRRTPMARSIWERFIGMPGARLAAERAAAGGVRTARLIGRGKNDWVIERALQEQSIGVVSDPLGTADVELVGTLSPGPMLDVLERSPDAIAPDYSIGRWVRSCLLSPVAA
ncbi:MAG: glycosyltransferase [Planctomycetota bacterium]